MGLFGVPGVERDQTVSPELQTALLSRPEGKARVGEEEVGETYLLYTADIPADLPGPTLFQQMRDLLRGRGEEPSLAAFCLKVG